jgi:hypothetical protein
MFYSENRRQWNKSLPSGNSKLRMLLTSAITAGYVQWPVKDFPEERTVPGRCCCAVSAKLNAPSAVVCSFSEAEHLSLKHAGGSHLKGFA